MIDPAKVYEGNPCKRGHGGLRWKVNGACVDCNRAVSKVVGRNRYADPEWAEQKREYERERFRNFTNPDYRHRRHQIDMAARKRRIQTIDAELAKEVSVGEV